MKKRPSLPILHFYVGVSLILFFGIQYLKGADFPAPDWIFHHGNDFLCIPIVSLIALRVIWFLKKDKQIRIPCLSILCLVLVFSVYFEVYLPRVNSRYTGDWRDMGCYLLGGMIFYGLQYSKDTKSSYIIKPGESE